jgi:hypothetical protein
MALTCCDLDTPKLRSNSKRYMNDTFTNKNLRQTRKGKAKLDLQIYLSTAIREKSRFSWQGQLTRMQHDLSPSVNIIDNGVPYTYNR